MPVIGSYTQDGIHPHTERYPDVERGPRISNRISEAWGFTSRVEQRLSPDDWANLLRGTRAKNRLFTENWYEAWSEGYLPTERLRGPLQYLVARDQDGVAMGVLPFVFLRVAKLAFLSLAGHSDPYRIIPVVEAARDHVCESLADGLARYRGPLATRLGPTEEDDPTILRLLGALKHRGWRVHNIDYDQQHIVALPRSVENFQRSLSKKLRKNIRWNSNRLKRDGEVEIRAYRNLSPAQWEDVIANIRSIESRCWLMKDDEGKPRFCGERRTRYWQRLLKDSETSRNASAWLLFFNEKPVSFSFAFDSGPYRYNIAGQYDEAVKDYSTGWIVDKSMFEDAIEKGIEYVNMGDDCAPYKSRWGAKPASYLRDHIAFRPGFVGHGLYLGAETKRRMESLYGNMSRLVGDLFPAK